MSLPAPPWSVSTWPVAVAPVPVVSSPPYSTSLPLLPKTLLARALPFSTTLALIWPPDALRAKRFSTLAPSVKLTLVRTRSMPPVATAESLSVTVSPASSTM